MVSEGHDSREVDQSSMKFLSTWLRNLQALMNIVGNLINPQ